MSSFAVNITTDNAAFDEDYGAEVARILRHLARDVEAGATPAVLFDVNGNRVGTVEVTG